jgi:iron complex outermembrane recepter protein
VVSFRTWSPRLIRLLVWFALPLAAVARPVTFDLPTQPVAQALLAFSQQAKTDVLFPYDELQAVASRSVIGRMEPEQALRQLLAGTGYTARRNHRGKWVVGAAPLEGRISGRLLSPDGEPVAGARVMIPPLRRATVTDANGEYRLEPIPPGRHRVIATLRGYRTLEYAEVAVAGGRTTELDVVVLEPVLEPSRLAPYIVEERAEDHRPFDRSTPPPAPRTAAGNLDLRRTEGDVLAYTIFDRDRIMRSGVIDLNDFLQRELLESDASSVAPGAGEAGLVSAGSSNLRLRGYGAEETVILINGRRLPEILTTIDAGTAPPDVSFIPLSLVQRVEVLPASASALYSGNAVGGVINIVLRPDVDVNATEVMTTYSNALHGYDAPQSSVSLMHGRSFLNGALRLRLNGTFSRTLPPTEAEIGHRQRRVEPVTPLSEPLYRATPNVRTTDLSPLFGPGSAAVTSVAPGADGAGGLAAFAGREGVRSTTLFDGPGGLSSALNSLDYVYGREQERAAWFLSTVYDVNPRLQLGFDGIHSRTSLTRGYDLFTADLALAAEAPGNPFDRDVRVALNETATALGPDYSRARIDFSSAVLGALVRLPRDWRVMADAQYARNTVRYRGLAGVDAGRWQQLVDEGRYQPLRDTQVHGAPPAFYDEVVIYRGRRGEYLPLGDYSVLDGALRLTREKLPLPTGDALLNVGADYRQTQFHGFTEQWQYGDGTPAAPAVDWQSRALERLSVFGELQAALLPQAWTPGWLRRAEVDLAARYITADTSQETNLAPTYGLKLDFASGWALRGSISTSNRYPNPKMARPASSGPGTGGSKLALITDPRRGGQSYDVIENEVINLDLRPEDAVTQTIGAIFERGQLHRFRASVDFFDTRKTNEAIFILPQTAVYLEEVWPERVLRAPSGPGDPTGPITAVITGRANAAWRHSQNWTAAMNYDWTECFGGTLELTTRWMYFQQFDLQLLPNYPIVDQLENPDGSMPGLLRHRGNFGAGWSNRNFGFGADGRYFHSQRLRVDERALQGSDVIQAHWQLDLYAHTDLRRWLPWQGSRYGLRAQVRVNNILGPQFPFYWATGVQPYGDWRGRTYSFSLTAVF